VLYTICFARLGASGICWQTFCPVVPMRTEFAKTEEFKDSRRWYHVDAGGRVLGRLATRVAVALMGKDQPGFARHVDTGAYVVVTNAAKVRLTGRKLSQKAYHRYSGYPGGLKEIPARVMLEKHPDRLISEAVRRMLPKNKLGMAMMKRLRVYAGSSHPHAYHKPEELPV